MENALTKFNLASNAMSELCEALAGAQTEFNGNIDELNDSLEHIDQMNEQKSHDEDNAKTLVANLQTQIKSLEDQLVENSKNSERLLFERNNTALELRELRALDPKNLIKVNKKLKKEKTDLMTRLTNSEAARKEALKQHKIMLTKRQNEGVVCVHSDPETGNQLKLLPSLKVSKTNVYNGCPETPVIEFFHKASGIVRQGTLLRDGTMGWASAKNSTPSKQESKIARLRIVEFCESRKIKLQVDSNV